MDIKTRIATLEDLEEIYQIERVCFETSDIFHKETFEFFLTTNEVIFLLAVNTEKKKSGNDLIVGFIIVQPKFKSKFEITTIDVHPDWQNKGIGSLLLREIEERILIRINDDNREKIDCFIELVVYENNHSAKKLYTNMGYQILGKLHSYYSRDRDGLRMGKKLSKE